MKHQPNVAPTATVAQPMTPKQYLATHELTARLKRLGIRPAQLNSVRFKMSEGDEFRDWRVINFAPSRSSKSVAHLWPENLFHEMRVWCTFRWLILDDPPESRDRRDAWDLVARYLAEPSFKAKQKQDANLSAGRQTANSARKDDADRKAVEKYRQWELAAATQIASLNAAARLRKFFVARKIGAHAKRRYSRLLKENRLAAPKK